MYTSTREAKVFVKSYLPVREIKRLSNENDHKPDLEKLPFARQALRTTSPSPTDHAQN